jgi:hypothetical protein
MVTKLDLPKGLMSRGLVAVEPDEPGVAAAQSDPA